MAPPDRLFWVFPLKFKHSGKSPASLFNNLERIENKGVFSAGKTPDVGIFFRRQFSLA